MPWESSVLRRAAMERARKSVLHGQVPDVEARILDADRAGLRDNAIIKDISGEIGWWELAWGEPFGED